MGATTISPRRKKFVQEYVKSLNALQAALKVGYSKHTAESEAGVMLKEPKTAKYLRSLMDKINAKAELSAELVVEELRRLALSNIADYYKRDPKTKGYVLKSFDELTPAQTAAIARYDPKTGYILHSKEGALDKLGKYFKLYSEIPALVNNYVIMPTIKVNGQPHAFDIGKPKKPR